MKIAMVSEHASPLATLGGVDAGGQNVHVAELAHALGRRGHEVVVYTRRDDPTLPPRVPMADGVVVEHLDAGPAAPITKDEIAPLVPQLGHDLMRRLSQSAPDVLHAHFWMSGIAALLAARAVDVPVVQTFHALGTVKRRFQGEDDTSPAERLACERRIARSAARVIASSTDERAELNAMGADATRIDIVPSGVDRDLFGVDGPVARRGRRHRLLVVSRLVRRKGIDDAIRALARLDDDVELVVAGGPGGADFDTDPEVRRLRSLSRELGVADRVMLLGSVARTELPPLVRSADAVLCLPWYEPFGIVPLEAMACGVPVIATGVGGLLDTVVPGVTGLHVPPREPAAAAHAVRTLLGDPALHARMSVAGTTRAAAYDWSEIAAMVEKTYLACPVSDGRVAAEARR